MDDKGVDIGAGFLSVSMDKAPRSIEKEILEYGGWTPTSLVCGEKADAKMYFTKSGTFNRIGDEVKFVKDE